MRLETLVTTLKFVGLFSCSTILRRVGRRLLRLVLLAIIVATAEGTARDVQEEGVRKKQLIMELTVQDWKDAIELYGIQESIIPDRQNAVAGPEAS